MRPFQGDASGAGVRTQPALLAPLPKRLQLPVPHVRTEYPRTAREEGQAMILGRKECQAIRNRVHRLFFPPALAGSLAHAYPGLHLVQDLVLREVRRALKKARAK